MNTKKGICPMSKASTTSSSPPPAQAHPVPVRSTSKQTGDAQPNGDGADLREIDNELAAEAEALLADDAAMIEDDVPDEDVVIKGDASTPTDDVSTKEEADAEKDDPPTTEASSEPVAEEDTTQRKPSATPEATTPAKSAQPVLAKFFRCVSNVIVSVLVVVNFPVRCIPQSIRPVFNWFALSLLFWVPAIWILAMFVVG